MPVVSLCVVLSSLLDTYQIGRDLYIFQLFFACFTSCKMSSSVTGSKNIVFSTSFGKYCVNRISLHLGIIFASDEPIFTKKWLMRLAI